MATPRYKPHCPKCRYLRPAFLTFHGVLMDADTFYCLRGGETALIWARPSADSSISYFYLCQMEERGYPIEDRATLINLLAMANATPPPDPEAPINTKHPVATPATDAAVAREGGSAMVPSRELSNTELRWIPTIERFPLGLAFQGDGPNRFFYIGSLEIRGMAMHDVYFRVGGSDGQTGLGTMGYRAENSRTRASWLRWSEIGWHASGDNWAQVIRDIRDWMLTPQGYAVVANRMAAAYGIVCPHITPEMR